MFTLPDPDTILLDADFDAQPTEDEMADYYEFRTASFNSDEVDPQDHFSECLMRWHDRSY